MRLKLLTTLLLLPLWMAAGGSVRSPASIHEPAAVSAGGLSPAAPAVSTAAEAGLLLAGVKTPGGQRTPSSPSAAAQADAAARSRTMATSRLRLSFVQRLADGRLNIPTTYGNPPPRSHS